MNSNEEMKKMGFATQAIHAGHMKNTFGALATPIYQTSTFIFDSAEQGGRRFALEEDGYIYSRLGNPSCAEIEAKVAMLEGGEAALATASGMGAITSAVWTNIEKGDHILAAKTLYGCTFAYLNHGVTKFGIDVDFIDMTDLDLVKKSLKKNTKIVYLETPANPNMTIIDIEKVAKIVHDYNKDCVVIVDNTYCSPYIQKPLSLGADMVVHSATKYLNGHGDVIAGFVISRKDLVDKARLEGVAKIVHDYNKDCVVIVDNTYCSPYIQKPLSLGADMVVHSATKYLNGHGDVIAGFVISRKDLVDKARLVGVKDFTGSVLAPFNAYLINRGLKTLEIRMERHCYNAMKVAEFLEKHPKIASIQYPGLKSFGAYEVAKKQMKLPGAMMSFELKGGLEAGKKLMNSVKLCTLAVSLGDCETLIQHPASMTHSPYTQEERLNAGITDGMVRLSVGLENVDDIIADLKQAKRSKSVV